MKFWVGFVALLAVVAIVLRKRAATPTRRRTSKNRKPKDRIALPSKKEGSIVSEGRAGFVEISDHDFFGQATRSQNRQFLVAWSDSDDENNSGRGGNRNSGKGRVFLARQDCVLWHRWLERPNGASVANNGAVAIADWLFGDTLSGVFYLFSAEGETLIEKTLRANISDCGITGDGALAWCATCGSDDPKHDARLFVFTVSPPRALFCTAEVNSMWIDAVSRCGDQVVVVDRDGKRTSFSLDADEE